jgi:hypothetical protein
MCAIEHDQSTTLCNGRLACCRSWFGREHMSTLVDDLAMSELNTDEAFPFAELLTRQTSAHKTLQLNGCGPLCALLCLAWT